MTEQLGFSVTIEAQLERFEKAMRDGGRVVDTTAAGMDKATQRAAKSFTRLEGALDPASRALQRYERDVNKVKIAVDTGAISQERASAVLERLDQQYRRAAMGSEMFEVAQQRASIMSGRMGNSIQQAGYQVGDFAVQIASGQSPLRAFIQQGTQLISMFGPYGALAGAALAIGGALYTAFATDPIDKAEDKVKSFSDEIKDADKDVKALGLSLQTLQEKQLGTFRGPEEQFLRSLKERLTPEYEAALGQIDVVEKRIEAANKQLADLQVNPFVNQQEIYAVQGNIQSLQVILQSTLSSTEEIRDAWGSVDERLRKVRDTLDGIASAENRVVTQKAYDDLVKYEEDAQSKILISQEKAAEERTRQLEKEAQDRLRAAEKAIRDQEKMERDAVKRAQDMRGDNSLVTGGPSPESIAQFDRMNLASERTRDAIEKYNKVMKEGEGVTLSLRDASEVHADTLENLNELYTKGAISQQTYSRGVSKANAALKESDPFVQGLAQGFKGLSSDLLQFGENAESASDRAKRAIVNMAETVASKLQELSITNPILNALFGTGLQTIGDSGFLSSLFSSGPTQGAAVNGSFNASTGTAGRATGGPVTAGTPYIVGEKRPELFVPSVSGTIIPSVPKSLDPGSRMPSMSSRSAGGMVVNMTLNNPTRDMVPMLVDQLKSLNAKVNTVDRSIGPRAIAAVQGESQRNPGYRRSVGG